MDDIEVQIQDASGMWRTVAVVFNNSQRILLEMRSIQVRYPGFRVRAIGPDGRLVDVL